MSFDTKWLRAKRRYYRRIVQVQSNYRKGDIDHILRDNLVSIYKHLLDAQATNLQQNPGARYD